MASSRKSQSGLARSARATASRCCSPPDRRCAQLSSTLRLSRNSGRRAAVSYPGLEGQFADADIREALAAVCLPHLRDSIDVEDNWAQRLSGGEQQRLAVARALLAKPDWLFLDEATAALDEPTEKEIYRVLMDRLPEATLVSIGHRSTLIDFHERRIDMRPGADGMFTPTDIRAPVAAQ